MLHERSLTKGYTLYDSIYIKLHKRQNYSYRNQVTGSQKLVGEEKEMTTERHVGAFLR